MIKELAVLNIKTILKAPLLKRKALFLRSRDQYYNDPHGKTLLSDSDFDLLEDSIREEDPKWDGLKKTGTAVKKFKVNLQFKMPSLDKTNADTVMKWIDQNESSYILLADKLDGTSIQLQYDNGLPSKCFTRGTGVVGKDVSFIIPHLKIPKKISYKKQLNLRCEGAFKDTVFKQYQHEFDSARNAASGMFNRTSHSVHPGIRNLDLIVVTLLNPWTTPKKGLDFAAKLGFQVVPHKLIPTKSLTPEKLVKILSTRKGNTKYEKDGLVLYWEKQNPKLTGDKPDWAVAFKSNDEPTTVKVLGIEWNVSAHGILAPVALLEPTKFGGATVKRASVNNAKWMIDRKIGPGALVRLVRSGEIIPKIVEVLKPGKPSMPPKDLGAYEWDKNGVQFKLTNPEDSATAKAKQIVRFFTKVGVEFIKLGTAQKFYDAGLDSTIKILRAQPRDFMKVEGIQEKGAQKIYDSIQNLFLKGALLPNLMEASGKFDRGMGAKRIQQIQKIYPNLLGLAEVPKRELYNRIVEVPMFSDTMAKMFVEGIYDFAAWFKKTGIVIKKPERIKVASDKLSGINVSFTGFRNKDYEEIIKKNKGNLISFGTKTNVLLVSPTGKSSTKVDKAEQRGIKVMTWQQFTKRYGI